MAGMETLGCAPHEIEARTRRVLRWARRRALLLVVPAAFLVAPATGRASEVKIFQAAGADTFLQAELDGVSVDALGVVRLAERYDRVATIEEPFAFAAVPVADGWIVGTGNAGKVLRIGSDGSVNELYAAAEEQVHALMVDPDGSVVFGTSPEGKVYKMSPDGSSVETLFSPQERYIWALARDAQGRLLVATGTEGRLYRVQDGEGEVILDAEDPHLRCLLVRDSGDILVGTAGEGLILQVDEQGKVRTLFDADQPEVAALVPGPDGDVFAAALASEGSFVELNKPAAATDDGDDATLADAAAVGSRPAGFKGARSTVLRLRPSGEVQTLWSFDKETVFSLAYLDGQLWAGTGMDGKLFRFRDGQAVLEKDADELQIVALLPDRGGPALLTTNAAALYRRSGEREGEGTMTSPPIDAGLVASFGTLSWRGEGDGDAVRFTARSGQSPNPDETWSEWLPPQAGSQIPLADIPHGRYLQWRAILSGGKQTPSLLSVDVSYLQTNRKPEIKTLEVLDPGEVIVPSNFNPSNQAYEVAHPNRDGIFTRLGSTGDDDNQRTKNLWKQGYRTVRWKVEDANGDGLEYALDVRREIGTDSNADTGGTWLPVGKELEGDYLSFDATVLPDGWYRFRLTASDAPGNVAGNELSAEQITKPVLIDHSPPELGAITRREGAARVAVRDALSPLREAMVSVDAGGWQPVRAEDGLVDSTTETLEIPLPEGVSIVLLRLTDASNNVRTFDLTAALAARGQRRAP